MQVGNQEKPIHKKCVVCGKEVFGVERTVCDEDGGMLAPVGREPQPGDIFADRYEIVSLIGDGGWGKVYKAQHRLMKRAVAIKVLLPHLIKSQQALKRFQQEARAASSLNHPNVMTVFDFGMTDDGLPYLVMDFLEGTSLSATLQELHYLPIERSLRIFVQVCEGLAHAHEKGVIHRDIKPNNLMLVNFIGQSDFVKIVDFGIAKIATPSEGEGEELTQTGEIFGSPMYMSPEQCRGKELDARSDIYSTGCVLYRCLTGRPAFAGRDAMECMFRQVHEAPVCFRDVCPDFNLPMSLEAIVQKALAKEPDERFQHMIEFRDALIDLYRDIVGETPVTASTQLRLYAVAPGSAEEIEKSEKTDILSKETSATSDAPIMVPADQSAVAAVKPSTPPETVAAATVPTPAPSPKEPVKASAPEVKVVEHASPPSSIVKSSEPAARPASPSSGPKKGGLPVPALIGALVLIVGCVVGIPLMHKPEPAVSPPTIGSETETATVTDTTPIVVPAVVNTRVVEDSVTKAKAAIAEGEYQDAITALRTAQAEAEKLSDAKLGDKFLLEILPLLGDSFLDVDNPDAALKAFLAVLDKAGAAFGVDTPEYARIETGLAIASAYTGDIATAEPHLTHALAVLERQPTADRKGLCDVYYGLARVAESRKDFNKANQYLSEALKRKQAEGPPDLETANLMVNVAQSYMLRRQYPKARGLLEQALAIEKAKLGDDSISVAGTMKNLAVVNYQTGNPAKAESLFKQALDINNRLNSSDSLLAAEIMSSLAILYANDGKLDAALGLAKQSLDIRKRMLGDASPQVKRDQAMIANLNRAVAKKQKH
ncbi:MAG: tetratricopeptide repeat protein [Candidatus Obscuribacterales bacterium]|nr:tetratricopeptide repeat protein [Candidatus Obscuribacterales bacterium]